MISLDVGFLKIIKGSTISSVESDIALPMGRDMSSPGRVGTPLNQTCCGSHLEQLRIASPTSRRASSHSGVHQVNESRAEGVIAMAPIIEFHIPTGFTPTTKYVPAQERGALIVFPPT